jgi:hypothetical protein
MILLNIIGWIFLILLILILLLLISPVEYMAHGQKYDSSSVHAKVRYLFGAIRFQFDKEEGSEAAYSLKVLSWSVKGKTHVSSKKKEDRKGKKEKSRSSIKYFLDHGYRSQLIESINKGIRHVKPKRIVINCTYGFDDPFDTAVTWGLLNCINIWGRDCSINPVYDDEILEGNFLVEGRIIPAAILWIIVKFRFSEPVINIKRNERKERKYVNQC